MAKINGDLLVQGFHLNLKPEQLALDPTSEELGASPRIWGNSTDGKLKYHNGTAVIDLTALGLTEEELTAALAAYVKTTDLPAPVDISGLATKTALTDAVADLATKTALTDAVALLATKTELTTATQNLVSQTVMQGAIDNALAGLDFQSDVLGLETDFVNVAGRYIYVDGSLFTTGVPAAVNDIVEVSDTGEVLSVAYGVATAGPGALVYNRAVKSFFRWDDTAWSDFGGLTAITNGNGLDKSGDVFSVKAADSSIVVGATGVKVGDLSATYVTPAAQAIALADYATDAELTAAVADLATKTELAAVVARIEASEFQFTPQEAGTTIEVVHNFGNKYPIVQVVDTDDTVIGVDEVKFVDVNTLTVKLSVAGTPKVIVQGLKALV